MSMRKFICRVLKTQIGTTSIEYGLIGRLIAITIVGAVSNIGATELSVTFTKVNAAFTG